MITILHFGLGRFHRAHQAVYYQKLNQLGESWEVVSMSMRSPDARDELREAKFHYPVIQCGPNSTVLWVDAIKESYSCADDLALVLECFVRPEIEIITLTITEKGYDLDATGRLDLRKMKEDLSHPEQPKTAIGILALGLHYRRQKNLKGLTIISCDNLRENSQKLRHALRDYFSALGWSEDLEWLEKQNTFPNSMVDRIVPALKEEKILELEKKFHLPKNSHLIATEEFSQWVIEDHFYGTRPPFEKVGVTFVSDVRPYEEMKLKLLNAAHSFLAYAGINKGYQFVHEAIADADLREGVQSLFHEVIPLLMIPEGFDADEYGKRLIQRFENSELPHQLRQIAMDGSQKLPQRIFPSFMDATRSGRSHKTLTRVIREWIGFCRNVCIACEKLDDPLADQIKMIPHDDEKKWSESFLQLGMFHAFNQDEIRQLR